VVGEFMGAPCFGTRAVQRHREIPDFTLLSEAGDTAAEKLTT